MAGRGAKQPSLLGIFALTAAVGVWTAGWGCVARPVSSALVADDLQVRVEAALAAASDVSAVGISVATVGDIVTLTGRVASGFEQQSVGAIVRALPGVSEVRFALSIDDPQAGR